jgi:hypothetical protein
MQNERKHMIIRTSFPDRPRAVAIAALMLLAHNPTGALAGSDAVLAMCLDAGDAIETCECASEKLRDGIGAEAYASYGRSGETYLAGMAQGKGRSDAWDEALAVEGLELSATNDWGKAHFEAMKACAP